jgi:hypothetical protein
MDCCLVGSSILAQANTKRDSDAECAAGGERGERGAGSGGLG